MVQGAPAALMAAVSLIMRILLVCWLSDGLFSTTSAELLGGAWDMKRHDYGNRRPLHYVRTLRQPIIRGSQASGDHDKTQQGTIIRNQKKPPKQTLSRPLPQGFSSRPAQQRSPQPARPRGFQLNLDIPLLELGQNQMPHTVTKDSHESPPAEVNLRSSPQSSSFSVLEKFRPDPQGWESDHVPKLQLGLSPSTAVRMPSLSTSDYVRLAHLIKEGTNVQSRYVEPAQQLLDLMQAESRPPLNYADTVRKQLTQIGTNWPILSSDAGKRQNQEVASEKPAKESENWHPAQHGSPALPPAEQSWAYRKPDVGKLPPHPTRKHSEQQVDWYGNAHTGMPQDHDKDRTSLSKPHLHPSSVLQREITHKYHQLPGDRKYGNYEPSNIEILGSVALHDSAFGKGLQKTAEAGLELSSPRLQLSLSLPIQAKPPNVQVHGTGNQNVKMAKQITQTGSNWPSSSSEFTKPAPQTEMKWPILSFNAGQQQPNVYIQTQPAIKPPFSTQYSSQRTSRPNRDETPTGLSPGVRQPAARLSAVSYSPTNTRDDSYSNYPGQRNYLGKAVGLPAPGSYHSSGKFSEHPHGIQHLSAPQSDDYGMLKPSTERAGTAERMHLGSTFDLPSLTPPNWYAAAATSAYETRPDHQQKHVFSEESSHHRHGFPSVYETQKTLPRETGQHVHDGRDKSAKVFINIEHGAADINGPSDTDGYSGKWHGETEGPQSHTTNPSTINLQAQMSVDKGALTDLLKSHHQSRSPSYVQSGCMGQAGDCSQQSHRFPKQDLYTPYAEATSVTVPSNAQQQFVESRSYHL